MTEIRKAHCNDCGQNRNHELLHIEHQSWTDYDGDGDPMYTETSTYEMLKCCGCEAITTRLSENAPWYDVEQVRYFPPALSRKLPQWLSRLRFTHGETGEYVGTLLRQIYAAFQNELYALAAMGVRALIEYIMIKQSGDHRSFGKNLAAFRDTGHVSEKQAEQLKAILEVGHASIHRGHLPDGSDVSTVIDITENVIESVYVHVDPVERLKSTTPKRL